ncbi:MAG: transglutaminase family protein [Chromatiales bacterium]|nr:transglutaminase family protein [Chromatiales bacterium]
MAVQRPRSQQGSAAPGGCWPKCLNRTPGSRGAAHAGPAIPQAKIRPRWSLGLYRRRDGQPVWSGPADPLAAGAGRSLPPGRSTNSGSSVAQRLGARGWTALLFAVESYPNLRIVFRRDACRCWPARRGIRAWPAPARTASRSRRRDCATSWPEAGNLLLGIDWPGPEQDLGEAAAPRVELPACGERGAVSEPAGRRSARPRARPDSPGLILTGFPPPVDAAVAWTTLTPDPAVVEVNMALTPDAAGFLRESRGLFRRRRRRRDWRLTGCTTTAQVADSGGGGQITLGGPVAARQPVPAASPPAAGAWSATSTATRRCRTCFADDYVGSFGQSARADERDRRRTSTNSALALACCERQRIAPPESALAEPGAVSRRHRRQHPPRRDSTSRSCGTPTCPERGQLGLVEFRALRMPHTPERLVGAGRTAARGGRHAGPAQPATPELADWGRGTARPLRPALLPARRTCGTVLDELDRRRPGPGPAADRRNCWTTSSAVLGEVRLRRLPSCTVRRAPGILAAARRCRSRRSRAHSRLVDASTARLELSLRATVRARDGGAGGLATDGERLSAAVARGRTNWMGKPGCAGCATAASNPGPACIPSWRRRVRSSWC